MTLDLDALEAAARAATPGPWVASGGALPCKPDDTRRCKDHDTDEPHIGVYFINTPRYSAATELDRNDALYVDAASPDVVLTLVARLRAAEALLAAQTRCHACDCELLPRDDTPRCDTCSLDEDADECALAGLRRAWLALRCAP